MNVLSYHYEHDPHFSGDPLSEARGLLYGLFATFVLWAVVGLALMAWLNG